MAAPLENPEVDLTLLTAARTLGAGLAFIGAWFALILWNHSASPVLEKLSGIGFGGVWGHGAIHPLRFLHDVDHVVKNFLTGVMAGCERAMVHSFGALLWAFYDLAFTIVKLAYDANTAIDNVWHNLSAHVTKVITHTVVRPVARVVRTTVAVTRAQFGHLTHRVDTLAARVAHLTATAGHAIAQPFPRIGHLEREVANDAKRLGKLEKRIAGTALTALVVGALAKLGLNWIRCNAAKSLHRKRGCNLWNMMDDLFGLFLDVAVLANICQVIPWLEEGFSAVASPLIGKIAAAGAGLCDASYAKGAQIEPPVLHVPAADGTLYLPGV